MMSVVEICLCVLASSAVLALVLVLLYRAIPGEAELNSQELQWMRDERKRAFELLGADDYPDGDLCDWITSMNKDCPQKCMYDAAVSCDIPDYEDCGGCEHVPTLPELPPNRIVADYATKAKPGV